MNNQNNRNASTPRNNQASNGQFEKGSERAREAGRKGGQTSR